MSRITHIALDDANLPPPTPEIEQERKVAMFDLLEDNVFTLPSRDDRPVPQGPYHLGLSIRDKRLVFDVNTESAEKAAGCQRLFPDLRILFRGGQEIRPLADRDHRYGTARDSQRRLSGVARAA